MNTMTTIAIDRALLEQALNALTYKGHFPWADKEHFIDAIRAELAKPEQEETFIPNWANYRQGVADGKAGSPKWHDAPTCAGLWVSDYGKFEVEHVNQADVNSFDVAYNAGGRWYGPIPQDAKAEEKNHERP